MGQIIGRTAKPKRCNLNKLSQLGTPAAGEYILVSSDNSMDAAGQGDFDAYVKGDGAKPATELELKSLVDDGAFDISAYRATGNVLAKYVDLSAALDGGNNIPEAMRKGGISVKFVQSSDNKYVQYMLMSSTFTTIISAWQEINNTLLSQTLFGVTNAINLLSSTGGTVIANYLTIKQGQKLYYKITGTTSASRIILRYNENSSSNNIKDGIKVGEQYIFTAPADISKIYIWTNAGLTGNIELKFGFINEMDLDVKNLSNDIYGDNLSYSMNFVNGVNVKLITTDLIAGMTYNLTVSTNLAALSPITCYLKDNNGNNLKTVSLLQNNSSVQFSYTATDNYKDAYLCYTNQYGAFTAGTIITGSVVSVGLAKSVNENKTNIETLSKKIIYCRHYVYVIADLSKFSDIVVNDYILLYNSIIQVTDPSLLPSSGFVYRHDLKLSDSLYIADDETFIYNGTNFVRDYNKIAVISESTNLYDASSVINGFIKQDGTYSYDANTYSVTDYIPVSNGDTLIGWWDKNTEISYFQKPKFRYVCAYSITKQPLPNYGTQEVRSYTVNNANIAYVRISLYRADIGKTGFRINKGVPQPFADYFYGRAPLWGMNTKQEVAALLREPYKMLTEDVVNTLSYKRLGGPLEHGYIVLTTDDGREGLAEYTVPMLINKNVPCSFCIMSESVVMRDENPTMKAAVLDAVTNHNCEIVQHGANRWCSDYYNGALRDGYSEWELRDFFAREKAYWDNLDITVKAAAVPEHVINNTVKAVAGGLYGICRCGYNEGTKHYDYYCNGPKSNMYALSSQNVMDNNLDYHKAAIDYAVAHHYIYILYWHEIDLNETQKQKLEAVIDYAKTTDIVFAKLGDVPDLV